MNADQAQHLAQKYQIDLTKNFFVLSASEVCQVVEAAKDYHYRKPRHANGSRGRYFFADLQRAARKELPSCPR